MIRYFCFLYLSYISKWDFFKIFFINLLCIFIPFRGKNAFFRLSFQREVLSRLCLQTKNLKLNIKFLPLLSRALSSLYHFTSKNERTFFFYFRLKIKIIATKKVSFSSRFKSKVLLNNTKTAKDNGTLLIASFLLKQVNI